MNIRRTQLADRDLVGIHQYTRERFGLAQANRYIDRLFSAFRILADNPAIGSPRTEISPPVRLYAVAQHLIIYRETGGDILIVRVLHQRMDYEQLL